MPISFAGTEVYIHTLASLQKKEGHNPVIVTPHIEHYRPGKMVPHFVYEGLDVYQFKETGNPADRAFIYGRKPPEGLANFNELLHLLKPDIVHFHELNRSIGLGIGHVRLAKSAGAKVLLTMHLSSYTCNTNTLINKGKLCSGKILDFKCSVCSYKSKYNFSAAVSTSLARASILSDRVGFTSLLPSGRATTLIGMPISIKRIRRELHELSLHVDHFVSLTQWYKKILLLNGIPAEKLTVISQALATVKDREYTIQKRLFQPPLRVVFIGRIQPQKGIHLLIQAFRDLDDREVTLDIYGMPEDTPYYQECINDSVQITSIKWMGFMNRENIIESLSSYDILCLPSAFSEMSPLVIQEAFAAGVPVLASDVYGNAEQITHKNNGLLFKFNCAESLKEEIVTLIKDKNMLQHLKDNIIAPDKFKEVNKAYTVLYNQ